VCPEVECGFPVPREAMRLVGDPAHPRLVTTRTNVDHTERMAAWAQRRVAELEREGLCGFVFKSNSPSSGMERVRVYDSNGVPSKAAELGDRLEAGDDLVPFNGDRDPRAAGRCEEGLERGVLVYQQLGQVLAFLALGIVGAARSRYGCGLNKVGRAMRAIIHEQRHARVGGQVGKLARLARGGEDEAQ